MITLTNNHQITPPQPKAASGPSQQAGDQLTTSQKKTVQKMAARDREVRAHEQAHMSAGGQVTTGGPGYSYQTGPDGRRYAVGGEVGIDVSPVKGDPEATIRKMQVVRGAALAPAEPSGQDKQVAAKAAGLASKARAELAAKEAEAEDEFGQAPRSGEILDLLV